MKKILKLLCSSILFLLLTVFASCTLSPCPHSEMSSSQVAPTCEEQGYTLWQCTACDYSYQTDFVPSTEHVMVDSIIAPTCTHEGYTLHACDCGYSYKSTFTEPTDHVYTDTLVSATCESEGYRLHTCKTCDESYKTEILSATGHSLSATASVATCTDPGFTQYDCENCDLVYYTDVVAPLGHDFFTTYCLHPTLSESGKLMQSCSRCEQKFSNFLNYNDVFTNAYVSGTSVLAKGVDVSKHNHTPKNAANTEFFPLNWNAIKQAGFDFAILRAGYIGVKDPVFEMNYIDARAAGMDLGVYYYTYAKNPEQALEEAEELIRWLEGKQFEYPIYYDIEAESLMSIDKEILTECCITFVDALRKAGYYCAVYSGNNFLNNYLNATTLKEYGELWYARYYRDPADPEKKKDFTIAADDDNFAWRSDFGAQVGMWQYTECGVIDGIDGVKFDFNYAFKDYPSMIKRFCFNGFEAVELQE